VKRGLRVEGRPAWDSGANRHKGILSRGIDVTRLSPDEEGTFLCATEAGLAVGSSYKIRAPLSRGRMVDQLFMRVRRSIIRITESVPNGNSRVHEKRLAAHAFASQGASSGGARLRCICRNLILASSSTSRTGISRRTRGVPLAGFETYGEIAARCR